jgi:threonine synthase
MEYNPYGKGIWKYKTLLPSIRRISFGEGDTPIYRLNRIEKKLGIEEVYAKFEGTNPSGSSKDRGSAICVSDASEKRFTRMACASLGNEGASLAMYCAREDLEAKVYIPSHKRKEIVKQIETYGAKITHAPNFKQCLELAMEEAEKKKSYLGVAGYNPYFTEGEKTIAFEVYDEISTPDRVIVPAGTGAAVMAIWKGFRELKELGVLSEIPKMTISQAEGYSPIINALESNYKKLSKPVLMPVIDMGQETMKRTGKLITDTGKFTEKMITDIDKTKTMTKVMGTGRKLFKGSQKTLKKTGKILTDTGKKTSKLITKTGRKTTKMLTKYDKTKTLKKTTEMLTEIDKKTRQKLQYETGDIAHAIAFKESICLDLAKRAVESSNGFGETVHNSEIIDAFELLGKEGIYADYSSATTLAALIKLKHKNIVKKDERVVLVLTSHGLKNF